MHPQGADCVEHRQHHHADVGEDSGPHIRQAHRDRAPGRANFMHQREDDVLIYDAEALVGDARWPWRSSAGRRPSARRRQPRWPASDPIAPMAMPISARESTGASLMPSPTKASFSFAPSAAPAASPPALPCRRAAARCAPRPRRALPPPALPRACVSPVSMTVFSTPRLLQRRRWPPLRAASPRRR